ncbi:MAG: (d)CMP kinase [Proteobacteria bacterium]|nr:(d)CMP kinase [Pseudomonadota bacterium]
MNNISNTVVIAFDGTAASGKGVVAKLLAEKLGYDYLDTGLMFRKVAYYCDMQNLTLDNNHVLIELIKKIDFNKPIDSKELYSDNISDVASKIATLEGVRNALLDIQRKFAKNKQGVVIDGRDIGTVVFPNADYKFFFDASIEERANRRYKQLQNDGKSIKLSSVLEYLKIRDERDKSRNIAPLVRAEGSFLIDTSRISIDEVLKIVLKKIKSN